MGADRLAGCDVLLEFAVADNQSARHQNVPEAFRELSCALKGGFIDDGRWVEDVDIGIRANLQPQIPDR